jgi:predicted acyltransferase
MTTMTPGRLVSLDAFRGATVASMILVNNPGSWATIYWPLAHAQWHGWTPTDLIFPFFLFIVGASLAFSSRESTAEAAVRAAKIFGLGFFMAWYPRFDLSTVRIPGVLQRIAICYFVVFVLKKFFAPRGLLGATAGLLVGYWALLTMVPLPDGSAPSLEAGKDLGAWIDRALMPGHLWVSSKTWDPEGILSTLPAIATTILGYLSGRLFRLGLEPVDVLRRLVSGGVVLTVSGLAWSGVFPINKSLWTSSYALFTAGLACFTLALFYWAADVRERRVGMKPLVVYGVNAIVVFVASGLLAKTLGLIRIDGVASNVWIYRAFFTPWLSPHDASLAYALANVLGWYLVLWWMDRRGWHIKV